MSRKVLFFFVACILFTESHAQTSYPWERPLKMAWSTDGTAFDKFTIFQDSSGVPSVIRWKGDTLVCVFQWFRLPKNAVTWDKVAVKFSYNAGVTWTKPTPIVVNGIPGNYQRPFDPTLAVVSKTSLRIYFSSSSAMPIGLDGSVNTYSAISADGINYTFENNPRFDQPSRPVIDPAIIYFNNSWHYAAPAGPPQDGAYHATGSDGLNFIQQGMYTSDMQHNWTGNFMLNSPTELRFYGSGQQIWFNSSGDGTTWQGYVNTNIKGGDPSVVKLSSSSYLAIYVGEHYVTRIVDQSAGKGFMVYPNPFDSYIIMDYNLPNSYQYQIYSVTGAVAQAGKIDRERISTSELSKGMYLLRIITDEGEIKCFRIVKK